MEPILIRLIRVQYGSLFIKNFKPENPKIWAYCERVGQKKAMKKIVIALSFLMLSLSANASCVLEGWSDQLNCWNGYGNCGWCVTGDVYTGAPNQMLATLSLSQDQTQLTISYMAGLNQGDNGIIVLANSVVVPAAICKQIGVNSITIAAGVYQPDYTNNPYGDYYAQVTVQ